MTVPGWYALLLLAGATFRVYRLIAEDTILDRPRRWLLRLDTTWEKEGDPVPEGYRAGLGSWLTCPWCAGFWIAVAWWAAWQAWPENTLIAASLFTISALVGLIAKLDTE